MDNCPPTLDATSGGGPEMKGSPPWPPPTLPPPLDLELAARRRTIAVLQGRAFAMAARTRRALIEAAWWDQ